VSALRAQSRGVEHGQRYDRLVIRNVIVIDGKGTPARGPQDIVVEGNKIAAVRGANARPDAYKNEKHVLDGTGMYLLPGLINSHVHLQDERAGIPQPFEYEYKVWLSCGITTIRDVGSDVKKALVERRKSQEGTIVAPRLYIYMVAGGATPEEGRKAVRAIKEQGGDGVKIFGMDRDIMAAIVDESKKLGLKVAHHIGVEETDARDAAAFGVSTLEHWYGIPDAALKGSQNFPPSYNYNNESDRFRWAGRLWREADPVKLDAVLTEMIAKGVAWIPTFSTYEACRDMTRARNLPWFKEYLHPVLEDYFKPGPPWRVLLGLVDRGRDRLEGKLQDLDEGRERFRRQGRPGRRGRRRGLHLHALRLHLPERARAPAGGRLPPHRRHPVRHREQRQDHGPREPVGAGAPGLPGRPDPHR
jgi:hypothetical protein